MPVVSGPDKRKRVQPVRLSEQHESDNMQTIGRMVSGVAHDFNNLLTGIVLCSDLLLAGLEKDSPLRRYALEIRGAGAQGAGLVQQLLAVARERRSEPCLLRFNDVIAETRELLLRLIGENIELATELDPELEAITMDPAQARQILLNLVLNARDAMPAGGRIVLLTRNSSTPATAIEFEVCDNGCGIDAGDRAKVFEPFFTTKGPGKGNGLGLSTVQSIVKENGGRVEIESEPGKGTRVIVQLPVAGSAIRPAEFARPAEQISESKTDTYVERRGKRA